MSRPRADSITAASTHRRQRTTSQSAHLESAISAIQQKNENLAAANAAFVAGTGGFIGGPPVAAPANGGGRGGSGVKHRSSVRHRKDPTAFTLNGKRVRTTERIASDVGQLYIIYRATIIHAFLVG